MDMAGGRHWLCSVLNFIYTSTAVWSVLLCPQVLYHYVL